MIMNVHSDAPYFSKVDARNIACRHFSWVGKQKTANPSSSTVHSLPCVQFFASLLLPPQKPNLGPYSLTAKRAWYFEWLSSQPQPKTQVHSNNATAVGIANNTVKKKHLQSTEIRYFWVCDKIAQDDISLKWNTGQENLADYQSKHHLGPHHHAVRPW